MKWRRHAPDVLPLWVAEMDVPLAPAVHDALAVALARGDTGYAVGTEYAEALAGFASERWGCHGLAVERTALVPDVMLGIVEVLHLISVPGWRRTRATELRDVAEHPRGGGTTGWAPWRRRGRRGW